jgi:hypothetical protein
MQREIFIKDGETLRETEWGREKSDGDNGMSGEEQLRG